MEEELKDFVRKCVVFKYPLPNTINEIDKVSITTDTDKCFESLGDEKIEQLILNGLVHYCYGDAIIEKDGTDYSVLLKRALKSKLPDVTVDNANRYGFHGEVILHLLLECFFSNCLLIAKGHFYHPTSNGEITGYDSFHFYYDDDSLVIVVGEVKFHQSILTAADDVIRKITQNTT